MRNCWSHSGSYLGQIGIQQVVDGQVEKVALVSGSAVEGFASVKINGVDMTVGQKYSNGLLSVNHVNSHVVDVQTSSFSFHYENSDLFINQEVKARVPLSLMTAHGLFGQTHHRQLYPSSLKYIAGGVDDYVINENELFGNDFVYNQFNA